MTVNLFVQLPARHPGAGAPAYFGGVAQGIAWAAVRGGVALAPHVRLGLALIVMGAVFFVLALRWRRRTWSWVSALGLSGLIGAGFNGASFHNYGHDFSSMLMAVCFPLAAAMYTGGLYASR